MARVLHPMWPPGVVETVCKVIASSSEYPGLTGSEIGRLLAMRGFRDVAPAATKWRRLEAALQTQQQHDRASNCLIRFITDAMEPSRYVGDPNRFSALRDGLTEALALVGLKVNVARSRGRQSPGTSTSLRSSPDACRRSCAARRA